MFETTSQNSMDRIKAWLSTCHVMRPSLRQGSHHFLATQSFTGVSTHIFRGGDDQWDPQTDPQVTMGFNTKIVKKDWLMTGGTPCH